MIFRNTFVAYISSLVITVSLLCLVPLLISDTFELPVPAALPYSTENNPWLFWITYAHHAWSGFSYLCIHGGVDNLFVGLLLLIRRQQEILKYRLRNLTKLCTFNCGNLKREIKIQHKIIKYCIYDHEKIHK